MTRVLHAADVAALDAAAERAGHPTDVLMTRAGRAVAGFACRVRPSARRVAVLAGPGNNGGDGYVAAAELAHRGRVVVVVEVTDTPKTAAARAARAALAALPAGARARLTLRPGPPDAALLAGVDLVVDALLGAGRARPVSGSLLTWFDAVVRTGPPVLAVDVPSGLDADRAGLDGPVLAATWTLQLGAAKPAAFLEPARSAYGAWSVDDLGLPGDLVSAHAQTAAWDLGDAGAALPRRAAADHKYTAGTVLVVAGSPRYPGAAALASRAAYRAGAGYVAAAGEGPHPTEVVRLEWTPTPDGAAALMRHETVRRADALVIGPGLEADAGTLRALVTAADVPVVVDGGALHPVLADALRAHGRAVLTPHAAEAARWLDRSPREVAADPIASASAMAGACGAVVLLKGPGSVVAAPDGAVALVAPGPPALATAGTGDVLAGALAALLAASVARGDEGRADRLVALSATAAVLHAEAGRRALARHAAAGHPPSAGISAVDVAEALPQARAALEAAAEAARGGPRDGC